MVLLGWMTAVIVICVMQPLIVMANKCDVRKISELSEENQVNDIQKSSYTVQELLELKETWRD